MEPMENAARHACRAWFTGEPMGGAMSALADQLALIDKGQTHGTYSQAWDRTGGQGSQRGQGDDQGIAAEVARSHSPIGAAQDGC